MVQSAKQLAVVIDDHSLRRMALARLLESWANAAGLEIFQVENPASLRSMEIDPERCRICILYLGAETLGCVKAQVTIALLETLLPGLPLVVMSDSDAPREIRFAHRDKLRGFIPTSLEPGIATAALDLLLRGGEYFPRIRCTGHGPDEDCESHDDHSSEDENAGSSLKCGSHDPGRGLTPRQEAVLAGLRKGHSNKEIARDLDVSEATVKIHMRQLMRKLGAANRTQAAIMALRNGSEVNLQTERLDEHRAAPFGARPRHDNTTAISGRVTSERH